MSKSIHNPHDHLFRSGMSDVRVAKDFFKQHLPANIISIIDWDSLQFQKTSFVDEELKDSIADVIYRVNIGKKKGYLYILVEHQSTVDYWIALRLWCYLIRLLQFHHQQYPKDCLPVIYPFIFYNGATEYTGSTDFYDLFGAQKELAKQILMEPFQLIDSQKIPDEELRRHQWAGILEFVLKHRFARDFLIFAEQVMQWLYQLELEDGYDYVSVVLKYIINGLEGSDINTLVAVAQQRLTPKTGDDVMTFADQARQQGYERGKQEGKTFADQARQQGYERGKQEGKTFADLEARRQIAKKMLEKEMSFDIIIETTGLSKDEVKKMMLTEEIDS